MRIMALTCVVAFSGSALAADAKPAGNWTKSSDGIELTFAFKKNDVMVFTLTNGTDGCVMTSKCTFEKDGAVKCEITKFEKQGNFNEEKPVGYKFSFKIEVKDKKARISNLEGDNIPAEAKSLVEGDYEKKDD